ncbi:MAG TPA: amidohydrolase family protein [Pseudonocardiaceae bacterium]|nr:amidohydrolase family protein [Pseudonocardiaceae bacterium]
MTREILPFVDELELIDHHCHPVVADELDSAGFQRLLTEADTVSPLGTSLFDSLIGLAVRRWCAPVLDLAPHAPAEEYLRRRAELGAAEVNRRLLAAARIADFCVDDGILATSTVPPAPVTHRVIRLEQLAEQVARDSTAAGFADAVRTALAERAPGAVGAKSIAAYRVGLALPAERPTDAEISAAADTWLASGTRLAEPTLHRFLIFAAIDLGLPVQIHTGLGDRDLDLHRCDPLLLTDLLRATESAGVPIVLLHNYPFHRHAGYLAQVFPHVFADFSLAAHNLGRRASAVLAEALELVPFGKFLFATDAFGLAELYHLGAQLFRRALSDFLSEGLAEDAFSLADATRIAKLIGADNARRVYQL